MDLEEEKILKDFQLMENRLKGLKNIPLGDTTV